ncbi:sulfate ABC transporter substrate-binding protein [Tsukamurella soli]|uniref:Sulfate ABC transporter substrate-binding protein n=1 Tax=Tsukamurella soli TaxID=644556 RepID=A0ABP8JD44_9ACTN
MPSRPGRRAVASLLAAAALFLTAACGGSTDTPGGIDISSGSHHLNLVAFSAGKPAFDVEIPLFRKTHPDIGFSQSYGASGDQSRKVVRHVPVDVVNFSVQPDVTRDVSAGLIDKNWESARPNKSVPFTSLVVIVVRQGNPKGIHDWADLLKPGVDVITPNPASSGSAKWNLMAPYAAASDGGRNPKAGQAFLKELIGKHIHISPSSGRDATTAFEAGQGDVLLSYESEAVMLQKQNKKAGLAPVEYLIPPQSIRIDLPVTVVNSSRDLAAANTFVDFLYTAQAQRALPAGGFRPVDPAIIAQTRDEFAAQPQFLWTVEQLGAELGKGTAGKTVSGKRLTKDLTGWPAVDNALFSANGVVTKLYQAGGQ